jgi:hypothetical protein
MWWYLFSLRGANSRGGTISAILVASILASVGAAFRSALAVGTTAITRAKMAPRPLSRSTTLGTPSIPELFVYDEKAYEGVQAMTRNGERFWRIGRRTRAARRYVSGQGAVEDRVSRQPDNSGCTCWAVTRNPCLDLISSECLGDPDKHVGHGITE